MKKVLSNNIATGIRQPYTKVTHEWYNAMMEDAVKALGSGLVGVNSNFVVLYGCVNSDSPNADISAGAVFYNGEIYLCPAFVDASITNDIVGTITTAFDVNDPVLFSDGNSYNVHQVKTIVWSDAALGSGDIDYVDLAFQSGTVKNVISIGNWNMDTTSGISVAHNISDISKVVAVSAMIIADSGTVVYPLDKITTGGGLEGGVASITTTDVVLNRIAAGFFDSASFSTTPFNRGFITVEVQL